MGSAPAYGQHRERPGDAHQLGDVHLLPGGVGEPHVAGSVVQRGDATDVLVRPKNAHDGPTPAANGTLVVVLARLYALTGDDEYRARAEQLLEVFSGEARRNPAVHAALLSGYGLLADPVQVVLMGEADDPSLAELRRTALGAPAPDLIATTVPPGAEPADGHPAAGKTMIEGRATAYVCVGRACLPPVTAPDDLADLLAPHRLRNLH